MENQSWQNYCVIDGKTSADDARIADLRRRTGADVQRGPKGGEIVIWRTETTDEAAVREYLDGLRTETKGKACVVMTVGEIAQIQNRYLIPPGFVGPSGFPVQPREDDPLLGAYRIRQDGITEPRPKD